MPDIDDLKHNIYIETKKHYEESTGLNNVNNVNNIKKGGPVYNSEGELLE